MDIDSLTDDELRIECERIMNTPRGCYTNYPRDIAAAWELVQAHVDGWDFSLRTDGMSYPAKWICDFEIEGRHNEVVADTAPRAICKAFLRAKGVGT